jgi:uncharacterized membrane protein
MTGKEPREGGRLRSVESVIGMVLKAGVALSVSLILFGLALLLARRGYAAGLRIDEPPPFPRALPELFSGLLSLDPGAVLVLGALTLIATPFARVATSIVAFALRRDWLYAGLTSLVLAILILGIAIGKAAG